MFLFFIYFFYKMEKHKEFWEKKHFNKEKYWLTGSKLVEIMSYHDLFDEIIVKNNKKNKILEIGVGMGNLIKELKDYYGIIFGCDISEKALNNVKHLANKTFLTNELNKIPPVDLAICHLVFQHCDDEMVKFIIQNVNLSNKGTFCFQFAELQGEPNKILKKNLGGDNPMYYRSLNRIREIVNETNKKIVKISKPVKFDTENLTWYMIRVVNK